MQLLVDPRPRVNFNFCWVTPSGLSTLPLAVMYYVPRCSDGISIPMVVANLRLHMAFDAPVSMIASFGTNPSTSNTLCLLEM